VHAAPGPHAHCPLPSHASLVVVSQVTVVEHAAPATPHTGYAIDVQPPVPQQPPGQVLALHVHAPLTHVKPTAH
jgi:hypothetical protein